MKRKHFPSLLKDFQLPNIVSDLRVRFSPRDLLSWCLYREKFVSARTRGRRGISQMWTGLDRREKGQKSPKICGHSFWMSPNHKAQKKLISYKKMCDIIFQIYGLNSSIHKCVCSIHKCVYVKAKLSMSHNCIEITY